MSRVTTAGWRGFRQVVGNPLLVFILLGVVFGGITLAVMPSKLVMPDEGSHFLRAYDMSVGRLSCELAAHGCEYPEVLVEKARQDQIPNGYDSANDPLPVPSHPSASMTLANSGSYNPVLHVPQAIGLVIGRLLGDTPDSLVFWGRLLNLLAYLAGVAAVIRYVRVGRWVFVVVGLVPQLVMQAASFSADSLNAVALFAMWAWILNAFVEVDSLGRRQLITLLLLTAGLSCGKMNGAVILLPLVFLPVTRFGPALATGAALWRRKLAIGLACAGVFVAVQAAWRLWMAMSWSAPPQPVGSRVGIVQFVKVLIRTYIIVPRSPQAVDDTGYADAVLRGMFGSFASFRYSLPWLVIIALIVLLTLAVVTRPAREPDFLRPAAFAWSALAAAGLNVIGTTYVMYTQWATLPWRLGPNALLADGVQGRYYTPFLVLLIPLGVWLTKWLSVEWRSDRWLGLAVALVSSGALLFFVVETWIWFDWSRLP